MALTYDLSNEGTINFIIETVESAENQERIRIHTANYEIVNGNQLKYIQEMLKQTYPEGYKEMTPMEFQIGKKIIRKLARSYSYGVKREVVDSEGVVNEPLTLLVNYIYADADDSEDAFNEIMKYADEYYINHRYVEVFCYENEDNRLRFKPLPQHLFTAMPNADKSRAEVIVFKQDPVLYSDTSAFIDFEHEKIEESFNIEGIYTLWSKERAMTVAKIKIDRKEEGKTLVIFKLAIVRKEANKEGKNPYSIMPFAMIKERTEGYFYPFGSEIARMSCKLNVVYTDIDTVARNQGFGQGVVYYTGEKPPAITKSGPTHLISIPNDEGKSKFEFVNANPDLTGHLSMFLTGVRILLTTNDLSTDKVSGEMSAQNFSSGIDRLLSESESVESIESQRKRYIGAEKNIYKIILAMLKKKMQEKSIPQDYPMEGISEAMLDANLYKLRLEYGSVKPITTEKEQAESITYLYDNGFILSWEKHMRFNPLLTPTQAKQREEEIQEERDENQSEMMKKQLPPDNNNADTMDMTDMENEDASQAEQGTKPRGNSKTQQEDDEQSGAAE